MKTSSKVKIIEIISQTCSKGFPARLKLEEIVQLQGFKPFLINSRKTCWVKPSLLFLDPERFANMNILPAATNQSAATVLVISKAVKIPSLKSGPNYGADADPFVSGSMVTRRQTLSRGRRNNISVTCFKGCPLCHCKGPPRNNK